MKASVLQKAPYPTLTHSNSPPCADISSAGGVSPEQGQNPPFPAAQAVGSAQDLLHPPSLHLGALCSCSCLPRSGWAQLWGTALLSHSDSFPGWIGWNVPCLDAFRGCKHIWDFQGKTGEAASKSKCCQQDSGAETILAEVSLVPFYGRHDSQSWSRLCSRSVEKRKSDHHILKLNHKWLPVKQNEQLLPRRRSATLDPGFHHHSHHVQTLHVTMMHRQSHHKFAHGNICVALQMFAFSFLSLLLLFCFESP